MRTPTQTTALTNKNGIYADKVVVACPDDCNPSFQDTEAGPLSLLSLSLSLLKNFCLFETGFLCVTLAVLELGL